MAPGYVISRELDSPPEPQLVLGFWVGTTSPGLSAPNHLSPPQTLLPDVLHGSLSFPLTLLSLASC